MLYFDDKNMKREKSISKREAFLKAALRRFSKNGYQASSTRDICADLGLAHSAIYNYFKSKDDILLELAEREMNALQSPLDQEMIDRQNSPVAERLEFATRYVIAYALERISLWRVLDQAPRYLRGKRRKVVVQLRDRFEMTFRHLLSEAINSGVIPPQDITLSVFHLIQLMIGPSRWFQSGGRLSQNEVATNICEFYFRAIGLVDGRAPPKIEAAIQRDEKLSSRKSQTAFPLT